MKGRWQGKDRESIYKGEQREGGGLRMGRRKGKGLRMGKEGREGGWERGRGEGSEVQD